ncbi:MAG: UvrD-helicase domain-containing protein [Acidimicrobiaceae bacterium]|nr:UvrD-helicase domain-containing protein [Acidimicrobiaceae bacterium]
MGLPNGSSTDFAPCYQVTTHSTPTTPWGRPSIRQIEFSDMVPWQSRYWELSPLRNAVRNTYSHVFLDEFQDCTTVQYRLDTGRLWIDGQRARSRGRHEATHHGLGGRLEGIFETFSCGLRRHAVEPLPGTSVRHPSRRMQTGGAGHGRSCRRAAIRSSVPAATLRWLTTKRPMTKPAICPTALRSGFTQAYPLRDCRAGQPRPRLLRRGSDGSA